VVVIGGCSCRPLSRVGCVLIPLSQAIPAVVVLRLYLIEPNEPRVIQDLAWQSSLDFISNQIVFWSVW
jgi:hypothetical protein